MKVLAKRYDHYTRSLTDVIYIKGDRVCWLRKVWGLDPDILLWKDKSVLKGAKWVNWEELTSLLDNSKESYGYLTIAKNYDY